jgi:2-iminobutanoate/2-iminopropanoate deaminase
MAGRPFDEQAIRILENLQACLQGIGLTSQDLVQVRVYLTDMGNWPRFNEHYARWLGEHRPARIMLGVSSLHFGVDVEVEAVALASERAAAG